MKLSARNQLHGTIVGLEKGAVNARVKIDVGGGNSITASITNEAVEDLELREGSKVTAVIKASDVMLMTD